MRKLVFILFISCLSLSIKANIHSQYVRGRIVDRDTKIPLYGVNVYVVDSDPALGTSTDINGYFTIENVEIGRITIRLSYLGYETRTVPNITVSSGKEVFLNLDMQESLVNLNEVTINGGTQKGELNNEMALLSARQVTVEETQRFSGSLDDPSRMVSAFAGVASDPQGNNDIIIRGNSPKGLLWRLEGVEIPNPNHFSDESTTGGPINALSSNMLSNSDFFTGAFAPEFGNAISGVFDVQMRNGNNQTPEYSFGLGALGTDIAAEGPFKKGYNGSYLVNYRFSSLELLDKAGLVDFGGVPEYQDLTFKFFIPTKNAGTFKLFGLGGKSAMDDIVEDEDGTELERDDYHAHMATVGVKHRYHFNSKASLQTTLSASQNGSKLMYYENENGSLVYYGNGKWNKSTLRGTAQYNHKISAQHHLSAGINYAQFYYNMSDNFYNKEEDRWEQYLNLNENAGMFQSYASWKYRILPSLTAVSGLHYTQFMLNNAKSIEPRLAINWQLSAKQSLSFGYGKHSMAESIVMYSIQVYDENGMASTPNKNLELSKSDHYVLGYQYHFNKKLNAKVEAYYQYLHDIPVEDVDTSNFSMINYSHAYIDKKLVNDGLGYNYGLEFTLERYFYDNYYFLFTASLYESKYKALEGKWRNTRYNGNYAFNLLLGKEFTIGKPDKGNKLNLNAKFMYNGGQRYIPVNLEQSIAKNTEVLDYNRAFDNRLDNVHQMNFTASYTINRPKVRHEIYLDIYNVLNTQGRITEVYDENTQRLDYYTQLSMLPNIMYKIHF